MPTVRRWRRGRLAAPPGRRTRALLGPVRDVPHLRVPRRRVDALEALRHSRGREGAVDERDDHYIADEDVVRLDRKVVPLLLIRLLAERVDDRVEVRVGVS